MSAGAGFWNAVAAVSDEDLELLGRWEVVVADVPAEAVTNEAGDDWLYTFVGA